MMLFIFGSVSITRSERHNFATISLRETVVPAGPTRKISRLHGLFLELNWASLASKLLAPEV
jgi:hypothetical protein